MGSLAVFVVEFGIACDFIVAERARTRLRRFNERPPDTLPLESRFNAPSLDERHRRRSASWRVLAEIHLQKSDHAAVDFGDEDYRVLLVFGKVSARLDFVIREGVRPQLIAEPHPILSVAFDDFANCHAS